MGLFASVVLIVVLLSIIVLAINLLSRSCARQRNSAYSGNETRSGGSEVVCL